MRPRFSKRSPDYIPFGGGLDLLTAAIFMPPGKVISSQNYEPQIGGGYRRIAGYERYSGMTKPSASDYYLISITLTGSIANGATVTGVTSLATGISLGIFGTSLILGRVTGTFVSGEALQVTAVTQATSTSTAVVRGASSPSDDATYKASPETKVPVTRPRIRLVPNIPRDIPVAKLVTPVTVAPFAMDPVRVMLIR